MKTKGRIYRTKKIKELLDNILTSLSVGYIGFVGYFFLIILTKIMALLFGFIKVIDFNLNDLIFSGVSFGIFFLISLILLSKQNKRKVQKVNI